MARKYFQSAWGAVRLWLANISTDEGRALIVQQYTRGNVPDVRNAGNVPKVTRCTILFDEMSDDVDPQDRLEDLILLKDKGKPQLFTHPIHGTYLAEIQDFTYAIDSHGVITADATFIATEEVGAVTVDPIGMNPSTSVDAIDTRADELATELAAVDIESTVPADAVAASSAFDTTTTNARDVLVSVSSVSDRMWDEIEALQLAADVALWPAMKAYVMLGDAVRAGGDRQMGDLGAFMTVRVESATSLRRLMADIYGGRDASWRYDEAMSLNDIPTPGRIPGGMQLRLRQPGA